MTPEELTLFKGLLEKYLAWQCTHCNGANERQPSTQEITTRDCQAMYNFDKEGISHETLAAHFGCSVEYVSEQVSQRPWLLSRKSERSAINLTWWQSDHSDPLELVKLYYPQYLPEQASSETSAKEKHSDEYDWGAFFTKEYGADYAFQSDDTKRELIEWAESLPANSQPVLTFE